MMQDIATLHHAYIQDGVPVPLSWGSCRDLVGMPGSRTVFRSSSSVITWVVQVDELAAHSKSACRV